MTENVEMRWKGRLFKNYVEWGNDETESIAHPALGCTQLKNSKIEYLYCLSPNVMHSPVLSVHWSYVGTGKFVGCPDPSGSRNLSQKKMHQTRSWLGFAEPITCTWVRFHVDHQGGKQKCTRPSRTDHNKTKTNEIQQFYGLIMNHFYLSMP